MPKQTKIEHRSAPLRIPSLSLLLLLLPVAQSGQTPAPGVFSKGGGDKPGRWVTRTNAAGPAGQAANSSKSSNNLGSLVFNVRDFGAKGDGLADDTSAIRSALIAAQREGNWRQGNTGAMVFFPHGEYVISSKITTAPAPNGTGSILWGEGAQSTRIDCKMASGTCIDFSNSTLWGFSPGIRGIDIEGPGSASRTVCVSLSDSNFGAWGLHFSGFRINNCGVALLFHGNNNFNTFDNFEIQRNGQAIVVADGISNSGEYESFYNGVIANGSLRNDVFLQTGPLGEFNFFSVSFDSVQVTITNGAQFHCFACHFEDPSNPNGYSPWLRITGTHAYSQIGLDDCTFIEERPNYTPAKITASSGMVSIHNLHYEAATLSTQHFVELTGKAKLKADYASIFYAHDWVENEGSGPVSLPELGATTGLIGGSRLEAGICITKAVSIPGASAAVASGATIRVTPNKFPGTGFDWGRAYMSSNDTVTVQLCADSQGTPSASTYNVTVGK